MRVLIVGAGAVGQVYGYHLKQSGHHVGVLVRPKYVSDAEAGYPMLRHALMGRPRPVHFKPDAVVTGAEEAAAAGPWDQVWICVSATALRGAWRLELLQAVGDAAIVNLTPGLQDRALLLEDVPASRLVSGMIGFISYQAPLDGEELPEGVAYLLPPGSPSLFSGPEAAARAAVEGLVQGGCDARLVENVPRQMAFGSAVMMSHIAALELADWSLDAYRKGDLVNLAYDTAEEYLAVVGAYHGAAPPAAARALRPFVIRVALSLAPLLMPFDLEVYLRYHFTKVGDQTRAMLALNSAWGREHGISTARMEELLQRLEEGDTLRASA